MNLDLDFLLKIASTVLYICLLHIITKSTLISSINAPYTGRAVGRVLFLTKFSVCAFETFH